MQMPKVEWLDTIRHYTVKFSPDLSTAQIIHKIAINSPAQILGLSPGDALLSVNGVAAVGLDLDEVLLKASVVIYRFYSPHHNTIVDIRMKAMPLGVRFLVSAKAILGHARKTGYDGSSGFYKLWEQEDYDSIFALSRLVATKTPASLIRVVLGAGRPEPIARFMQAICNYERNNTESAARDIRKFVESDANSYCGDVQALGYYYLAMLARDGADLMYYTEYMRQAYELNPTSARICQGANLAKINIEQNHPMLGRMLPLHYKLQRIDRKTPMRSGADLPSLISRLSDGQVMPLCFMANSRANHAYNQALKSYRSMYDFLGNNLAPLVVITNKSRQKSDLALWYKQERLAHKNGLPMTVLLEKSGSFITDLDLKSAPVFWAVNQSGRVIWTDGLANSYDYWSLLYAVNGTGALYVEDFESYKSA
ncbi:MAG: hypothetical protein COA91_03260 [Robiginitomaculum sp.]|nr:MAG: hypothetical protein COA91_03260 [Robiginitomaculum sp.]